MSVRVDANEKAIKMIEDSLQSGTAGIAPSRPDWSRQLAITGLSNTSITDPIELLQKLASFMSLSFVDHHVDNYHIIPVVKNKPRVLVVNFVTQRYRNDWLQAKRVKGDIFLQDIFPSESRNKIYLNERSTAIERRCLFDARTFAKRENYQFCWMRRGQVYLRLNENSPTLKYPQDLDQNVVSQQTPTSAQISQTPTAHTSLTTSNQTRNAGTQ